MSKYPEVIDARVLEINAHISDEDIRKDIRDTEREIADYTRLENAEREVADTHPDPMQRKMADFRANARPSQIREREAFVAFLTRLLDARHATPGAVEVLASLGDGTAKDANA
jgi:hypothetical protein